MKRMFPANLLFVAGFGALGVAALIAPIGSTEGDVAGSSVLEPSQSLACTSCDARHKHLKRMGPAPEKDLLP